MSFRNKLILILEENKILTKYYDTTLDSIIDLIKTELLEGSKPKKQITESDSNTCLKCHYFGVEDD